MMYDAKPDTVTVTAIGAGARLTLRDNIRRTGDGWAADEYTLDVMRLCELESRVRRDFPAWLQMAKNKAVQNRRNTWKH